MLSSVGQSNNVQRFSAVNALRSGANLLNKPAEEFEAIFVTKMLTEMDKTVDREGGIFGEKTQYEDTFKSIIYQQIGHDIASNPRTSLGMAEQIYKQMEKYTK